MSEWWRSLDECIECPVSLESICNLTYEPFILKASEIHPVQHYFDGAFLASYLVSSSDFINPINRRDLTRDECVALDEYLQRHGLPDVSVVDAFDLKLTKG